MLGGNLPPIKMSFVSSDGGLFYWPLQNWPYRRLRYVDTLVRTSENYRIIDVPSQTIDKKWKKIDANYFNKVMLI